MTRFEIERMAQETNSAVKFHVDSTLNDMQTFDDFKYGRPKKMSTELTGFSAPSQIPVLISEQTTPLPYTAKGERRLRDRLEREGRSPEEVGLVSPQDPSLTPEKQKQMEAERRSLWRKERLKSLENVSFCPRLKLALTGLTSIPVKPISIKFFFTKIIS